jgi:hypothetical protein
MELTEASGMQARRRQSTTRSRDASRHRPAVEWLEARELMSASVGPTAEEQYMLQLVNRARANPAAEAQRLVALAQSDPVLKQATKSWDIAAFARTLSAIAPQAPLAFNTRLIEAARDQSHTMLATNNQAHSASGYLTNASVARADDGAAYYPIGSGSWSTGENVFAYSRNVVATQLDDYADYFHAAFLIDWGNPDYSHLDNVMAPGPSTAAGTGRRPYSEIGIGLLTNVSPTVAVPATATIAANAGLNVGPAIVTQEFGYRSGNPFLTGAFYLDADGNNFYTPGEALDNVLIRAVGSAGQGTFETVNWSSGGYSLQLPIGGTYAVTAYRQGMVLATNTVTLGLDNAQWDVQRPGTLASDVPVPGDYNGDGRDDRAVWRSQTGEWIVTSPSGSITVTQWGLPGDVPVPGDYDGDGRNDLAVYRPSDGRWYVQLATGAVAHNGFPWGISTDQPVPGDYDGDGRSDFALWRPSTGRWYVVSPTSGTILKNAEWWGLPGDVPVSGDYDGDGRSDLAVWRTANARWYVRLANGTIQRNGEWWGLPGDQPVSGDFDGDGRTDLAVVRPQSGRSVWYVRYSSGGELHNPTTGAWGSSGDRLAPADFDGDRRTDLAVLSAGKWIVRIPGSPFPSESDPEIPTPVDPPSASPTVPTDGVVTPTSKRAALLAVQRARQQAAAAARRAAGRLTPLERWLQKHKATS